MTALRARLERHAVLAYSVLTLLISWGCLALALGPRAFPASADQLESVTAGLAILAGPTLAALLLTSVLDGAVGLRSLRSRLLRWRVPLGWYAVALLIAPAVAAATSFGLALFAPNYLPAILTSGDQGGLLTAAVASGIMIGLFEELGWTGFAVPRLRQHHDALRTGLLLGVVWGAWHFPLFWQRDSFVTTLGLALLLARLFSWLPPFRTLMVWVHERTDSLLVVVLMHVSLVMSTLLLQPVVTGTSLLVYILVWSAILWAAALAVTMTARRRHSARRPRPGMV
ncbi:MAG: CPBP family intramembrane metalloprotease [Deinococcales bacterium]